MKSGFLLLTLLFSFSSFATEINKDHKFIECTLGVHPVSDGKVYQKTVNVPLVGSTVGPLFADLTYLDKEIILRIDVSKTFKKDESRLTLQLFDNVEIGKLNPNEADNDKKMWAHNLGIYGFVANHNTDVASSYIEVKVQGAQQDEESLSAYVECGTPSSN